MNYKKAFISVLEDKIEELLQDDTKVSLNTVIKSVMEYYKDYDNLKNFSEYDWHTTIKQRIYDNSKYMVVIYPFPSEDGVINSYVARKGPFDFMEFRKNDAI